MKDHTGCKRGFYHLSKSYYANALLSGADYIDRVTIGFYHPEGGTTGEFEIEWKYLGAEITPRLEAYDDAWGALFEFRDVLAKLAEHDSDRMTPDAVCELLIGCGVADMTQRTYPHRIKE